MGIFKKKADVKINAYGYEKGDGLDATIVVHGTAKNLATLCEGIVDSCAKTIGEKEGLVGRIAFAEIVMDALEQADPVAYHFAIKHKDRKKNNKEATEAELALDKIFLDLLKKKLGEESGEADA